MLDKCTILVQRPKEVAVCGDKVVHVAICRVAQRPLAQPLAPHVPNFHRTTIWNDDKLRIFLVAVFTICADDYLGVVLWTEENALDGVRRM